MIKDDEFLQVIKHTPLVSIDLIIRNEDSDILLGQRCNKPAQNFWFVPGGRIQKNETIEQAFKRLINKELGINIAFSKASLLGAYNHIYADNYLGQAGINTHYVVLGFELTITTSQTLTGDNQHSRLQWWPLTELMQESKVHENTKAYFKIR